MYVKAKEWTSLNECVYMRKKRFKDLKKELKMQEVEGGTGGEKDILSEIEAWQG